MERLTESHYPTHLDWMRIRDGGGHHRGPPDSGGEAGGGQVDVRLLSDALDWSDCKIEQTNERKGNTGS